jgi:hypothetical protein
MNIITYMNPFNSVLSSLFYGDFLDSLIGILIFIALTFVGINFSRKFSSANEQFIISNPTTISNPIIFNVSAVFIFLLAIINLLVSIADFNTSDFFASLIDLIITIIFTFLLLTFASVYFSPAKMNIREDANSSVAEDFIAFLSFGLKLCAHFSKLIASIIVISAVIQLFYAAILLLGEDAYMATEQVMSAGGLFLVGIFMPIFIYIVFLFSYPIFNYLLAILHIPKLNK